MRFVELINYFDRIYIVNLPNREDRRAETIAEFLNIGVSIPDAKVCFFPATRPIEKEGFPSIGALGNLISQTRVMRDAMDRGLDRILVCEDDINFNDISAKDFTFIMRDLESAPWDIVSLGYLAPDKRPARYSGLVPWSGPTIGAHMYAVQGDAIKKFHDYLMMVRSRPPGHAKGGAMFFDGAFNMVRSQVPDISFYIASPCLAGQRSSRTDLHDLRIYDRVEPFRSMVSHLRAIKNRLQRWLKR